MAFKGQAVRVLIVPGLRDSGPAHWQSWLQAHCRGARRVVQDDWTQPDLNAWSARIAETLRAEPDGPWVAVAHSFGCLALAHHLIGAPRQEGPERGIAAALLVAPASPERLGVDVDTLRHRLPLPASMLASETDPWMSAASARAWARQWGSSFVNLGDAGHINAEAGFGPLPPALHLTRGLVQRVEQARRPSRAGVSEFLFAV